MLAFAGFVLASAGTAAPPEVSIAFDRAVREAPATGRLVLYLLREGAKAGSGDPADGPFWDDPQPMFGMDVSEWPPGAAVRVLDTSTGFPCRWSELPPGTYKARAVLDLHRDNSSWRREPGNLFSEVVTLSVPRDGAAAPVAISLSNIVRARGTPQADRTELFEVRSALLSDFHGRHVVLRAGVVLPTGYKAGEPGRAFAAVYEVPGFGGDYTGAFQRFHPYRARLPAGSPWLSLRDSVFWIVLDPESGNGHTLFADSANNGPWGRALVEELIPALEKKYGLAAQPAARLLRGHSSGGWSALWLAVTYPETFGACWSSSPDPVDFRRFQLADVYGWENVYDREGEVASYRRDGQVKMSIRQENLMEEVLGPDNTSGQQWDSWFATFGPRNERGNPAALFNPVTGAVNRSVAEQYRPYDLTDLLRRAPAKYAPLFRQRIRLVVGSEDNFYLNEAVALLRDELETVAAEPLAPGPGMIRIVPGRDHGTIFAAPEVQSIPAQMVEHLRGAGLIGP